MSLIGIDVGSSAVKAAAYGVDGTALAEHRIPIASRHPAPGHWEVDPAEVWAASANAIRRVATDRSARADPPRALSVAASGREVFPADALGDPLGPCLMAADARQAGAVDRLRAEAAPERWIELCGHAPERMDPVLRILWWREHHPDVERRASRFLGWHELVSLKLGESAVCDPGLAGRWLVFDPQVADWSEDRLERFGLDRDRLPEVRPWGQVAGTVRSDVAGSLGLPDDLPLAVGGFDASCAALGSGVVGPRTLGLACGSWHAGVVPVAGELAPAAVAAAESSVGPHPGATGLGLFHLSPNGGAVTAWAERLLGVSAVELEGSFTRRPSPVLGVPRLSSASEPPGRDADRGIPGGALIGLSLATSATDVLQALAEGMAYELALAVRALEEAGAAIEAIRATGGGARSAWWLQLVADLTSTPIEVGRPDAGTLGAAMLAGLAVGDHATLADAAGLATVETRHEPDPRRAELHRDRLEGYGGTGARLDRLDIPGGSWG